jgi:hypothetical protein
MAQYGGLRVCFSYFPGKSFVEAKLINCNFHGLDGATIFFQETRGVGGIKKNKNQSTHLTKERK